MASTTPFRKARLFTFRQASSMARADGCGSWLLAFPISPRMITLKRQPLAEIRRWIGLCLLAVAVTGAAAETAATRLTFMVPMRDGVKLATDVYLLNTNGAFPALLGRTPYNKGIMTSAGEDGARHGYATVLQDTRGRFASEGDNLPFEADGWAGHWDGYDT